MRTAAGMAARLTREPSPAQSGSSTVWAFGGTLIGVPSGPFLGPEIRGPAFGAAAAAGAPPRLGVGEAAAALAAGAAASAFGPNFGGLRAPASADPPPAAAPPAGGVAATGAAGLLPEEQPHETSSATARIEQRMGKTSWESKGAMEMVKPEKKDALGERKR